MHHPFGSHHQIKETVPCCLPYPHGRQSPITVLYIPSVVPLFHCLQLLTNYHSPPCPPPSASRLLLETSTVIDKEKGAILLTDYGLLSHDCTLAPK